MTPHQLAAPAIEEAVERAPVAVQPTDEIPLEALLAAIADLAEDWRVDVAYELEGETVVVRGVTPREDSRAPWILGE